MGLHGSKHDPSLSCSFGLCLFHRAASRLGSTDPSLLWGGAAGLLRRRFCLDIPPKREKENHHLQKCRLIQDMWVSSRVAWWWCKYDSINLRYIIFCLGLNFSRTFRRQFEFCQVKPFYQNYFSYMSQKLSMPACWPIQNMKIHEWWTHLFLGMTAFWHRSQGVPVYPGSDQLVSHQLMLAFWHSSFYESVFIWCFFCAMLLTIWGLHKFALRFSGTTAASWSFSIGGGFKTLFSGISFLGCLHRTKNFHYGLKAMLACGFLTGFCRDLYIPLTAATICHLLTKNTQASRHLEVRSSHVD